MRAFDENPEQIEETSNGGDSNPPINTNQSHSPIFLFNYVRAFDENPEQIEEISNDGEHFLFAFPSLRLD
jgi:hypothetical protein